MNCFCSKETTPVMGVGAWFNEPPRLASTVRGVGQSFDWGTLAQDVVKAGLQVGVVYAGSELGTSQPSHTTGVTAALPSPYTGQNLAPAVAPAAAGPTIPTWVWPVAIGGGLIALVAVLKR